MARRAPRQQGLGLGYVPFAAVGAELRFEVLSQKYERGSTLITRNLRFDAWTSVFGSERLTGALLDRLTHHVHILELSGDSFRLATSRTRQKRSAPETGSAPWQRQRKIVSASPASHAGLFTNLTGTLLLRKTVQIDSGVDKHGGRPHGAKRHTLTRADVDALYPMAERFRAVRRHADPHGKFLNPHLEALFS